MVALTPAHVEEARRTSRRPRDSGSTASASRPEAVQAELHSPLYLGGVRGQRRRDSRSGQAGGRPAGRGRAAGRAGLRAEPRASGRGVGRRRRGSEPANGTLRARRAVLATSAYTHQLLPQRHPPLHPALRLHPGERPAHGSQREAIGWRRRQGVTDGRTFFNYYRLTADGRVLWGTSEATYYRAIGSIPSCDHSPAHYAVAPGELEAPLPRAGRRSSGSTPGAVPICSTTRMTPFFGRRARGPAALRTRATPATDWAPPDWPGGSSRTWRSTVPSELLDLSLVTAETVPLSAGTAAILGGQRGDARACGEWIRVSRRVCCCGPGADGDWVLAAERKETADGRTVAAGRLA